MNEKELNNLEDLKVYSESAGGLYLRNSAKEVALNTIQQIVNSYQEKTHIELISLCAKLSENLAMFKLLTGVPEQIESIKKLFEEENQEQ
jgi:hypothetical protein